MNWLRALWDREPVRTVAVVTALLAFLQVFGVPITPEQNAAILALIVALLEWARSKVTPVK